MSDETIDLKDITRNFSGRINLQKLMIFHKNQDITKEKIVEILNSKLPKFLKGSLEQPGHGYFISEDINNLDEKYKYKPDFYVKLKQIHSNSVKIYYIKENWNETYQYISEESQKLRKNPSIVSILSSIIILNLEANFLAIIGPRKLTNKISEEFTRIIRDNNIGKLESALVFDSEFLAFLFWKNWKKEEINSPVPTFPTLIRDIGTEGEERDLTGRKIDVKDSLDAARSIVTLIAILEGKNPSGIRIFLNFSEVYTTFDIFSNGKINILQSYGDLNKAPLANKEIILNFSIFSYILLYNYWESLTPNLKYLSPDFIKELLKYAQDAGIEQYAGVPDVLKKYKLLRGEEEDS